MSRKGAWAYYYKTRVAPDHIDVLKMYADYKFFWQRHRYPGEAHFPENLWVDTWWVNNGGLAPKKNARGEVVETASDKLNQRFPPLPGGRHGKPPVNTNRPDTAERIARNMRCNIWAHKGYDATRGNMRSVRRVSDLDNAQQEPLLVKGKLNAVAEQKARRNVPFQRRESDVYDYPKQNQPPERIPVGKIQEAFSEQRVPPKRTDTSSKPSSAVAHRPEKLPPLAPLGHPNHPFAHQPEPDRSQPHSSGWDERPDDQRDRANVASRESDRARFPCSEDRGKTAMSNDGSDECTHFRYDRFADKH